MNVRALSEVATTMAENLKEHKRLIRKKLKSVKLLRTRKSADTKRLGELKTLEATYMLHAVELAWLTVHAFRQSIVEHRCAAEKSCLDERNVLIKTHYILQRLLSKRYLIITICICIHGIEISN